MRLIRHGCDMVDGKLVVKHVEVVIPFEAIDNPDGRCETCAICKNVLYPECTKKCGILGTDEEELA